MVDKVVDETLCHRAAINVFFSVSLMSVLKKFIPELTSLGLIITWDFLPEWRPIPENEISSLIVFCFCFKSAEAILCKKSAV